LNYHRLIARREFRVAVADQEPEPRRTVAEVHQVVTGLLRDPLRGAMCGDAEDMDPTGGVLDHREAVQPGQQHGVVMEKVAREDPVRLSAQEFGPGRTAAAGTGVDAGALEDGPDR
jgi:hypothetical protein